MISRSWSFLGYAFKKIFDEKISEFSDDEPLPHSEEYIH